MERAMDCEQKSLINLELVQGKELANQLKTQLDNQDSREMCELLAGKILSSYENALLLLKSSASILEESLPINSALESPHSCTSEDSPISEISNQSHLNVFKKRKAFPRWSEQIQVSSETGPETPNGDGYSWRKYGQKAILGATYPRAYYRCTHRHGQGCLATKQVQKSDNHPSTFGITYRGRHTCNQSRHAPPRKEEKKPKKQQTEEQLKQEHGIHKQTDDIVLHFGACLEPQEFGTKVERTPSFSFPSTLVESQNVENSFFVMPQQWSNQLNNFGLAQNLQTSESDLSEIWSAPNSGTNSPIGDLDFSLDQVEFDPDFPFDILEYFH